ncbi:MAG: sensor histidine kinase [Chloroflexi bacterium]|nr:sensor histidine kinase [Chloroflexota bacterium]
MMSSRTSVPSPQDEARRFVRPFFVLVVISLIVLYGYSVFLTPALRDPLRLVIFTALILITAVLHWLFTTLRLEQRGLIPYLVIQGLLCFVITLVGDNVSLAIGLYMMMIGEAFGGLGINWRGFMAMAYYLSLSAINFYLLFEGEQFIVWVMPIVPTSVFVVTFVWLFDRQNKAREAAQNALHDLDVAHRQLTDYAAQVEDLTLANERQRMARELHDTLAQGLAGLVLQLEAIDSHLSRGNTPKAQTITQQAMERARLTLADARRAIDDLRSGAVPEANLETAVRQETDRFTAASGIPCALSIDLPPALPADVRECAVRVVGEALANITRHAQARSTAVALHPIPCPQSGETAGRHALDIEVRDDGVGFDPAQIGAGHYGLIGLRERVRMIGGTLNIESAPGQGTTLKVILPFEDTGHGGTELQRG